MWALQRHNNYDYYKKKWGKKKLASAFCYGAFFLTISFHFNAVKMLPNMSVVLENPRLPQNDEENRSDNHQKKKKRKRKKKKIRLADLHCKIYIKKNTW